jgi:RIO kinase 1
MRALAKKTAYGRTVAAAQWSYAEFEALCRLWALGVPVPYPVQVTGSEVLMEFIGTGTVAAPRLAQCKERGPALHALLDQTVEILRALVRAGFAHGDLSAYNLLVHDGRVVVIDLPQVVDLAANPQGFDLLHRDCVNVCDWFARRGVECDVEALFAELVADAF